MVRAVSAAPSASQRKSTPSTIPLCRPDSHSWNQVDRSVLPPPAIRTSPPAAAPAITLRLTARFIPAFPSQNQREW